MLSSIKMQKSSSDNPNMATERNSADDTSQEVMDSNNMKHSDEEPIESNFHDDLPIVHPNQDLFGYGSFANTIAKCILGTKRPNGGVIAIHGPWGCGKSSLVNLVCHNIRNQRYQDLSKRPIIIPFNSWCYRTEKGIVSGFFKEFQSGLISWEADRVSSNARIDQSFVTDLTFLIGGLYAISQGVDIDSLIGVKNTFSKFKKFILKKIRRKQKLDNRGLEGLQFEIGQKLRESGVRVLIVIDDVDRLSQEEARSIFRLIKSVGRIENVMYLVAYDRKIAEEMFDKDYTSEGSHYLEKIIQASFDLSEPSQSTIINILNSRFKDIFGSKMFLTKRRTYDVVHEVVVPEMKNLRSVHRLANMLSVTYQSVEWNVDLPDFIALETFRLFHPNLYQAIRSRRSALTRSVQYTSGTSSQSSDNEIEDIYLLGEPAESRPRLKRCLISIFPSVVRTFSTPRSVDLRRWEDEKRVRSAIHFDTYFRFSISDDVVSNEEFQEFARNASNEDYVKSYFDTCINTKIDNRKSKASFLLDMISRNVDSINRNDVAPLLYAVYSIANELMKADTWVMEFGHSVTNFDRIGKLTRTLLEDRFEYTYISATFTTAVRCAQLNFQLEICKMLCNFHFNPGDCEAHDVWNFIDRDETVFLKGHALNDVKNAAESGTIFDYNDILNIFDCWHSVSDDKEDIKNTFNENFGYSDKLIKCAYEFGKVIPSISHDDVHARASLRRLGKYIDLEYFERRLNNCIKHEPLHEKDVNIIGRLLELLKLREKV